MNIKEAPLRLPEARKECNALIREIKSLNDFINSKGGDPEKKKQRKRNIAMFKRWKDGDDFTEIAKEFDMTPTSVGGICRRVEIRVMRGYNQYKHLKKYL